MISYELKLSHGQLSRLLVLVTDAQKELDASLNTERPSANVYEVERQELHSLNACLNNARTICATCGQGVQHD